jgi:predicted NAD/FAD-dependent oxidoreductase
MNNTPHIAIIGAGIAGLSCATALQQAGIRISVFDKSRGPAGRMSTRRADDWQCDHGAQYFTARHPDFRAEVARWQQAGVAGLWNPRLHVIDGVSLKQFGAPVERFVGIPRMTAPARLLADALPLQTQTTIKQLERHADGWHLFSAEHAWLDACFDAVILAMPAPQAAKLLQQAAPELATLAENVVMRGSWTLMLHFTAPVSLPFDAAFVNRGPLRWVARDSSKPGRDQPNHCETWVLQATAAWSEAHLEGNPDTVAAELLEAFEKLGGAIPKTWTAHRWLYADSDPALDIAYAWQATMGVGLCGDWLNGGKVEGAWLSGNALAKQVIESIKSD